MKLLKSRAGRRVLTGLININYSLRRRSGKARPGHEEVDSDMSDTQALFATMGSRFNSAAAAGLEAVFQYKLDEGAACYAAISEGNCVLEQGEHDSPSVVLLMDTNTFKEVLNGDTNGMQAFMSGRIRAEGDVMLAIRLEALFPVS